MGGVTPVTVAIGGDAAEKGYHGPRMVAAARCVSAKVGSQVVQSCLLTIQCCLEFRREVLQAREYMLTEQPLTPLQHDLGENRSVPCLLGQADFAIQGPDANVPDFALVMSKGLVEPLKSLEDRFYCRHTSEEIASHLFRRNGEPLTDGSPFAVAQDYGTICVVGVAEHPVWRTARIVGIWYWILRGLLDGCVCPSLYPTLRQGDQGTREWQKIVVIAVCSAVVGAFRVRSFGIVLIDLVAVDREVGHAVEVTALFPT